METEGRGRVIRDAPVSTDPRLAMLYDPSSTTDLLFTLHQHIFHKLCFGLRMADIQLRRERVNAKKRDGIMEFAALAGRSHLDGTAANKMDVESDEARIDREIGSVLRRLRVASGLSQQAVARRIGTSFQQVQKYERGVNRIPLSRLITLCDALGVTVVDVVGEVVEIAGGPTTRSAPPPETVRSRLGARAMAAVSRVEDPEVLEAVIRLLDTVNRGGTGGKRRGH